MERKNANEKRKPFVLLDLQSESIEYQYFQYEKQKKGRDS